MIPHRFSQYIFGFVLSGFMSLLVSGVSTLRAVGFADETFGLWLSAWLPSWIVAYPTLLVMAPVARRIVAALTDAPPSEP
ncbi:MAG: DUF2798 domain-containing protein [Pseudomonadota bacterium]